MATFNIKMLADGTTNATHTSGAKLVKLPGIATTDSEVLALVRKTPLVTVKGTFGKKDATAFVGTNQAKVVGKELADMLEGKGKGKGKGKDDSETLAEDIVGERNTVPANV